MTIAHLQGPVKGVKSYEKICSHLRHSQMFHDYEETVFKALDGVKLAGWEFRPGGYDGADDPKEQRNVAPPVWFMLIDWGKRPGGADNVEKANGALATWTMSIGRVCPDSALNEIAHRLWGSKECPTYFCKKERLLEYKKKPKDAAENLWAEYARKELEESLKAKIERTQEKMRAAMVAALQSPQFEQERTEYHERCIADEIKTVLIKFKDVAKPHVLKMAMDEFICHEIMDS
jgi:hypothetical protein